MLNLCWTCFGSDEDIVLSRLAGERSISQGGLAELLCSGSG